MPPPIATVRLVGPAGEPVDLRRTLSWAWADLPPLRLDAGVPSLTVTLRVPRGRPRTVVVGPGDDHAELRVRGRAPASATVDGLVAAVRSMLRLDEDLTPFYAVAAGDPDLVWAVGGAGRLTRSPTVFQDVVKTLCSTNCHWSAMRRMVAALVEHLGEATADGSGHAFPTPAAMADAGEGFYAEVVRAGYRGRSLREVARREARSLLAADPRLLDTTHLRAADRSGQGGRRRHPAALRPVRAVGGPGLLAVRHAC